MNKFLFIVVSLVISFSSVTGQGIIRGKVSDENGETVIGANVYLKGTSIGTATNLNGDYSLKITSTTPQILVISYIEFTTIEEEVNPKNGEVLIRNYILKTKAQELNEVVVIGRANRASENTIRTLKSKSAVSIDYISSETIKKIGDSNVASALARVPGVSTNGSFFTVRGIGDRYVKTTINGARIPTLDPFTNNIKLDLFPASLIDNIILTKTASPDLPGDWAGAYLSIETKDYPEKLSINAETSFGFNNQTSFNEVLSSERSKTDWLGFDNGFRDMDVPPVGVPNLAQGSIYNSILFGNLPDYYASLGVTAQTPWTDELTKLGLIQLGLLGEAEKDVKYTEALARYTANEGGYFQQGLNYHYKEFIDVAGKLPNNWMPTKRKAPLDFSQSFSIGNQTTLFGKPLGFIFGLRYASSMVFDPNVEYGRFSNFPDEMINTTDISKLNSGNLFSNLGILNSSTETNNWSGLINLAYNFNPNHSVAVMFMPNVIGVNRINWNNFLKNNDSGIQTDVSPSISYESRKQLVYQLKTEHFFKGSGLKVESNISFTDGSSNAPDGKKLVMNLNSGGGYDFINSDWPFRTFRELSENLLDVRVNAELPVENTHGFIRKFKFGGSYMHLYRYGKNVTYSVDYFGFPGNFSDPKTIMDINSFLPTNSKPYLAYSGLMGASNNIIGFHKISSAYAMLDYDIISRLRFSGGVRVEKSKMHTDRESFYLSRFSENDVRRGSLKPYIKDETIYLPSFNFIFRLNNKTDAPINARVNYSKTIARPSLRETTNFVTYDYETKTYIHGNTDLKNVGIQNYDFRLESFFTNGDNVSVSLFYKDFTNHIEFVDASYWQNTGKSYVKGIELEVKKNFLKNFSAMANVTFVKSLTTNVVQSVLVTTDRAMFGQAPYVINGLLAYSSSKLGLSAAITYNYQGEKLVITTLDVSPDIYELPRHLMDIKVSKNIGEHFSITLKCRDLLGTFNQKAYKYKVGWVDYEKYTYGTSYIFSISYKL